MLSIKDVIAESGEFYRIWVLPINMSLRKVIKTRSSFPTDEAVTKLFYLALRNISRKWTMPIRDWKAALNCFSIQFEERILLS